MNLRRGTTAATLLAAVLATIAAPGWSETLRLEGYGDYVDLSLDLAAPGFLVSGTTSVVPLLATNWGPGAADRPIVLLSSDAGVEIEGLVGCADPSRPQRQCGLPAMASGASQLAQLALHVDPFARGTALFGAAITSEAIDTNPGNEIRVVAMPIVAQVETRVALLDVVPEVLVDGRLAWTMRVDNDGPGAALQPQFINFSWAYNGAPVTAQCTAVGVASCPGQQHYLGPGGQWFIRFESPPLSETTPQIIIEAAVLPQESGNVPGNDAVTLVYRDVLLADGFE